jgi:hypothetical protein
MKFLVTILILACSLASGGPYQSCRQDLKIYHARSAELKKLAEEDEAERSGVELIKPGADFRDRKRRERVGAIFGEGCFQSADDYYSGAVVFQHGGDNLVDRSTQASAGAPDQLLIAAIWAKHAADLGHPSAKKLVAESVDRFLYTSGHRQLFGTQFFVVVGKPCACQIPVENSFPDDQRVIYLGYNREAYTALALKKLPRQESTCKIKACDFKLSDSPKGTIIGIW